MSTYAFQSDDFALSEEGVHFLRSNFNYKTISYDQVEEASIKRGAEIKNVFFVAVVGIAIAFKKGPILHLKDGQKVYQFRLRKVYKSNQDEAMVNYLRSKISNRFY